MLLNGAAQIQETSLPFRQFALLHSVTCVELRLITILGNCGCVVVASFLGVSSPLKLVGCSQISVASLTKLSLETGRVFEMSDTTLTLMLLIAQKDFIA
jgi:hypothetical protein